VCVCVCVNLMPVFSLALLFGVIVTLQESNFSDAPEGDNVLGTPSFEGKCLCISC
jgi:hypothetical protein